MNNTDAQSYLCHTPSRVLFNAEVEKKNKYADTCSAQCGHFTPLCFSVDGLAGTEAACFLKRMACRLSTRWDRSSFAILRNSVLCIRGYCTKWRSLGFENSAAIELY